jgi:hypothetical protein
VRIGRPLGVLLIIAGLVINKWTVERLLVPDGHLTSRMVLVALVVFEVLLVGDGLFLVIRDPTILLGSLVLLSASLLVGLVALEAALRWQYRNHPLVHWYPGEHDARDAKPYFRPDPDVGWTLWPDRIQHWRLGDSVTSFKSNSEGLRRLGEFDDACVRPRIVLLGDSFIFGAGIGDSVTIAMQLEDSLGHRADVYNLGMPGYGMDQMLMMLRHRALALCPDLVVVGFIDDDFQRSLTAYRAWEGLEKPLYLLDHDTLRLATTRDRPNPLARMLTQLGLAHAIIVRRRERAYFRPTGDDWWMLNTAIIRAIGRETARARVPVLFIRLPSQSDWMDFPNIHRFMDAEHLPFIDIADLAHYRNDIHLHNDVHFNPRGAGWAAGQVAQWVRASGPARLRTP